MPLIPQDKSYHNFADLTRIWGVPHFYDVVSNIPFIPVGLWGLAETKRTDWRCFFVGSVLTGIGSSYYHLDPHNETLVWDRLPMTICFMAMLSAVCKDYGQTYVKLLPCLLFGIGSVAFWAKYDELLPYALVQFGSLVWLFVLLTQFKSPYKSTLHLWQAFGCYGAAKLFEAFDKPINHMLFGLVSGHTLKHLAAALGFVFVIFHLQMEEGHTKT
jgi:hypothetical protein